MEMRNLLLPKERKEYRLAEKLGRLRSLRGLTQKEVTQAAGIDESAVLNYELARRTPGSEHMRGLAATLEVMPEALIPFDDVADHSELFLMIVGIADAYGFEFGHNDGFAYIEPMGAFFAEGIERWSRAYGEMSKKRGDLPRGLQAAEGRVSRALLKAGLPRRLSRLRPHEARFRAEVAE